MPTWCAAVEHPMGSADILADDWRKRLLDAIDLSSEFDQGGGVYQVPEISRLEKLGFIPLELLHVMKDVVGIKVAVFWLPDAPEVGFVAKYDFAWLAFRFLDMASLEVVPGESIVQNTLD